MNNSENAANYMTCIEDAYDKFIVVDTIDHNDLVLLTIKGSIEVFQCFVKILNINNNF